jgi:hypothetical protein
LETLRFAGGSCRKSRPDSSGRYSIQNFKKRRNNMTHKWMKVLLIAVCSAILPALLATRSFADTVIYSDMTDSASPTGYSYSSYLTNAVLGSGSLVGLYTEASEFTSSGSFSVTEIDVGIGYLSGYQTDDDALVSIWTDVSGAPGSQIGDTYTLTDLPQFESTSTQVTSATGITGIDLTAGTDYFLVVSPSGSDTVDEWNVANAAIGLEDTQYNGGAWRQYPNSGLGAFAVLGTPATTPTVEPASFLLFGTGLIGLALAVRKRSRQQRAARAVQMVRSDSCTKSGYRCDPPRTAPSPRARKPATKPA